MDGNATQPQPVKPATPARHTSHLSPVPLDELTVHKCGIVHHVEAQDDDMERLMAMGLCGGRIVELVQVGDPMILRVYGSRIGISARLASHIFVALCRPGCSCRESFQMSSCRVPETP